MHKTSIALQLRYVLGLQDLAAAIFCSQLHYWYQPKKNGGTKLQIKKNGHLWIAKSISEWSSECGLTEKQVRGAIDKLEKANLIVRMSFMFGNAPVTHIRATKPMPKGVLGKGEYLLNLSVDLPSKAPPCPTGHPHLPSGAPPLPSKAPPLKTQVKMGSKKGKTIHIKSGITQGVGGEQNSKLSTTYITHILPTEITGEESPPQEQIPKPLSGKVTIMKGKVLNSASEILKGLKQKNGTLPEKKSSVQKLIDIWRELVPKYNEAKFVSAFTIKQKGQLVQFAKKCEGHQESVLRYVLMNWIKYVKYVSKNQGVKVTPDTPTLGFLLKYVQEAVNLYMEANVAPKQEVPTKMQLIAPVQPLPKVTVEAEEKPATLADILALKPKK